jgi:hypothetical protein
MPSASSQLPFAGSQTGLAGAQIRSAGSAGIPARLERREARTRGRAQAQGRAEAKRLKLAPASFGGQGCPRSRLKGPRCR